jgi:type III pantothenate kinase
MTHAPTELLLDLGNTRLKWAWLHATAESRWEAPELPVSMPVSALVHSDESTSWAELFREPMPQRIWLASVAGTRTEALRKAIERHWQCQLVNIQTPSQHGRWRNSYAQPHSLGVDRFLGMLGALSIAAQSTAQIVVLAGTALTIDVLAQSGAHLGGLIVPGPSLMRTSLNHGTAQLPLVATSALDLGRSTQAAIAAGSTLACAALIDKIAAQLPQAQLCLCGGAAQELRGALISTHANYRDDLIMLGLREFVRAQL